MSHRRWPFTQLGLKRHFLERLVLINSLIQHFRIKTGKTVIKDLHQDNINPLHDLTLLILDQIQQRVEHFLSNECGQEMVVKGLVIIWGVRNLK